MGWISKNTASESRESITPLCLTLQATSGKYVPNIGLLHVSTVEQLQWRANELEMMMQKEAKGKRLG